MKPTCDAILALLLGDRPLWTEEELAREIGAPRHEAADALAELRAAGLVHVIRLEATQGPRLVFASRAAERAQYLDFSPATSAEGAQPK